MIDYVMSDEMYVMKNELQDTLINCTALFFVSFDFDHHACLSKFRDFQFWIRCMDEKEAKYAHAVLVEWIEMQISNLDISIFVDSRRKLYLIDFIDSKCTIYRYNTI